MEGKRIYIFFTYQFNQIGGSQMYTVGKAKYLHNLGWQVYIFAAGTGKSVIPDLNNYVKYYNGMDFLLRPPYKIKKYEQAPCLNLMLNQLGIFKPKDYEIIIESHDDVQSYWGEIFAFVLEARHFFVAVNEIYRPTSTIPHRTYGDNLDFFYFKWKRNEIATSIGALNKLFNGYKNITDFLVEMPDTIRERDPIQDVPFKIENLQKLDWNICHFGRAVKDYVPYVIEGVGELARRHPDKRINFMMIGNAEERMDLLKQTFKNLPNVLVTLLGDMVPIPRILFTKIDVICAISQSARFAANEDVLTICATVEDETRTPGVLGYDTESHIFGKATFSYIEALENVLVKKLYEGKKSTLPKLQPAEEIYDKFWTIVKNASLVKEYYTERLLQERIREWTAIFPFGAVARGARIILFGATEIAKDYCNQIRSQNNSPVELGRNYIKHMLPQPYCEIVATVDLHPEEFDNAVVGAERLEKRDYDAIVITAFLQDVQAVFDKIYQTVPDMVDRIIYNPRRCQF